MARKSEDGLAIDRSATRADWSWLAENAISMDKWRGETMQDGEEDRDAGIGHLFK
jgi:hypothetical protein